MSAERRSLMEPVEFHTEGKALIAHGYAARFDDLSQNLGGYVERVSPHAFSKTIRENDIRALFNHNESQVLGRLKSGTLRLAEDDKGLSYEIDLPDTTAGRDLAVLLERGDVSGSSFGFRTIDDKWAEHEDGTPLRTLTTVALRDIGPVTFPAYLGAEVGLRSFAEARSLDFAVVAATAKATGDLRSLLAPHCEPQADEHLDGRVQTTVMRQRLTWLYT